MGFFNTGSKIYMFGGTKHSPGGKKEISRRCFVYDTCNNPFNNVKEGPLMNTTKSKPIVLGPIDANFYVLNHILTSCDLEEFDPETETWTLLPPPPIADQGLGEKDDDYKVCSYAIVNKRILLSTLNKGIYAFDVISREWEHLGSQGDDSVNEPVSLR